MVAADQIFVQKWVSGMLRAIRESNLDDMAYWLVCSLEDYDPKKPEGAQKWLYSLKGLFPHRAVLWEKIRLLFENELMHPKLTLPQLETQVKNWGWEI